MRDYKEEARRLQEITEEKISKFTNFAEEEFTGYWDGRPHTFKSGQSKYIQDFKAKHFATALANRELLRIKLDEDGQIVRDVLGHPIFLIPNGDTYTNPKKPEDVPQFMQLYNRAYQKGQDDEASVKTKNEVSSELGVPVRERKSEIRERQNKEKLNQEETAEPTGMADLPVDEDEFEDKPLEQ